MIEKRQYWVVSPNVRNKSRTVGAWREESVKWKVAFMGWQPSDPNHKLGRKFAQEIKPGDVILIARRHGGQPEVVGFGQVTGKFKTRLTGLRPPETFGSLRQLEPFVPFSGASKGLPFMDALGPTAALHELHPEANSSHKRLCQWMEAKLSTRKPAAGKRPPAAPKVQLKIGSLPNNEELEYQVKSSRTVRQAKKREAELVARYQQWLADQDRTLKVLKTQMIHCDAYEEARQNLIEAKCSNKRQYIRMAAGQLLDYAYHFSSELGQCNKAVLLPGKPSPLSVIEWLRSLNISVIWEERDVFLDNANGKFT